MVAAGDPGSDIGPGEPRFRFLIAGYLGKISYGLYVYHALGNVLSNRIHPVHQAFVQLALRPIIALGLTILLASASYSVLEKPFLRLKQRFARVDSRPILGGRGRK